MRFLTTLPFVLCALPAFAQQGPPVPPLPPNPPHGQPRMMQMRTPRAEGGFEPNIIPNGTWWRYPETIKELGLTADQQKKMDDAFHQNRIQLIDLKALLEKEQLNLEPILNSNPPDTNKALAEISRIADLRAELEKADARMLLAIRAQLTADQWTRLQTLRPGVSFSTDGGRNWRPAGAENRNSVTTTCTQGPGDADAHKQCTTTTVTVKHEGGRPVVTTCIQAPGQAAPRCTTNPAGFGEGALNRQPLPEPPSLTPATFLLQNNNPGLPD
jgi:Spy/CpxP family protein refolding chaperone